VALFAAFKRVYPQYRHPDILALPWRVFLAYIREAAREAQRQKERDFFRGCEAGWREWLRHRDDWTRR